MRLWGNSPRAIRFSTYNMLDLFAGDPGGQSGHYRVVVEAIRALRADVLAVQEIKAPGIEAGQQRLRKLADDTGLRCLVPGSGQGEAVPALGLGSRGYHVGLLWRDGIGPAAGSLPRRHNHFWPALTWVSFDLGGPVVRHAAYHAPPFGRKIRADQNEVLVASLARPGTRVPTLVGADWNGESADRVLDERTGAWCLYEPGDPYAQVGWFEDMVHQCEWDYDALGNRCHRVDRTAGDVLWAGGLHDGAAPPCAPWQDTSGTQPGAASPVPGGRLVHSDILQPPNRGVRVNYLAGPEYLKTELERIREQVMNVE